MGRSFAPRAERGGRAGSAWLALAIVLVLAVPLVVALAALRAPRWYPIADQATIEMRLRDVWGAHPPLVGAWSRSGPSHPGPLAFYVMWPVYGALGSTAWAMQAATIGLHLAALAVVGWIAHRRGGTALVLGVAAALALLLRLYGLSAFTDPWNPFLPILWWVVFLLAVWSVLCDDVALLPVVVLAGSLAAQAHAGYVLLTLGLAGLAFGVALHAVLSGRAPPGSRRRARWWVVGALALGVVLWIPPLVDEIAHTGNLSALRIYSTSPPSPPIGWTGAVELMLVHLDPWRVVSSPLRVYGYLGNDTEAAGVLFLAVWLLSVVVGLRLRAAALLRLDVVLGAALLLGTLSMSSIFGQFSYYLTLWAWPLTALMMLAVGWTVALAVSRRHWAPPPARVRAVGAFVLVVAVLLPVGVLTARAGEFENVQGARPEVLGHLVAATAAALGPRGGRDGRYLVTWIDPIGLGADGLALLNELERLGFRVGAEPALRTQVGPHRVLARRRATAQVTLVVGPGIAAWRERPGQREVAYVDPRDRRQRAESVRLRARVVSELRAEGLDALVPILDTAILGVVLDRRLPEETRRRLGRLIDLGTPAAVFVGPPTEPLVPQVRLGDASA